ncbi:cupin domain-containing protein [Chloroflexota bacterium]
MSTYTVIADLATHSPIPEDGILSRTIHDDDQIRVIFFGFAVGEELSEHTAAMPALLQMISGEAKITLGEETIEAKPGAWIHMPANLAHSINATTPVVLLLTLLKGQ